MKKISVAIAVYNEEENLSTCLDSVKDWVDEIVVVDGGSADKTVEIAKKYSAKVIKADNPQIFHINKQKAIGACRSEWILQLDADEVVSPDLHKEILRITLNSQLSTLNSINGYWIPRKNYFLGKWLKKGGQYPDYTLRLYRKGKGRLPCKTVHEQAIVDGKVGYLKNALLHYPYPTFSEYLNKASIYTSLTARFLKEKKTKINLLSFIDYLVIKPISTFVNMYFRHLGILDGFPGFIFALFSALHHPIAFIKYWTKEKKI